MTAQADFHFHEGCWFCNTPVCETCTGIDRPHTALLRDAYVIVCPTCAGPLDLPVIPVDPEDLDATRPVDLDACGTCAGTGGVPVGLGLVPWEFEFDACPACDGTGLIRGAAA